jgi:hypothetical protein
MAVQQRSKVFESLRTAGYVALEIGLLYGIFMTIRSFSAGANLGAVFFISFLYCAVPIFVVAFLIVGMVKFFQDTGAE